MKNTTKQNEKFTKEISSIKYYPTKFYYNNTEYTLNTLDDLLGDLFSRKIITVAELAEASTELPPFIEQKMKDSKNDFNKKSTNELEQLESDLKELGYEGVLDKFNGFKLKPLGYDNEFNEIEQILYDGIYYYRNKDNAEDVTYLAKEGDKEGNVFKRLYSSSKLCKDFHPIISHQKKKTNYSRALNNLLKYVSKNPDKLLNNKIGHIHGLEKAIKGDDKKTRIGWNCDNDQNFVKKTEHFSYKKLYKNTIDDFSIQKDKNIKIPVSFTNDPKTPTFNFFDLEALEEVSETPSLDRFESTMKDDEIEVFRAWVYGLFDANNSGRQLMYLKCPGGTGKSSVVETIQDYLGSEAYFSGDLSKLSGDFAMSQIYNKRLLTLDDISEPNIFHGNTGSLIKRLTGGSDIDVNIKNGGMFNSKINIKLFIGANVAPNIKKEESNISRIIYIELGEFPEWVKKELYLLDDNGEVRYDKEGKPYMISNKEDYKKQLLSEMDSYLAKCKKSYIKLCPNVGDINTSAIRDVLYDKTSEADDKINDFIRDNIEFGKDSFCKTSELVQLLENTVVFQNNKMRNMLYKNIQLEKRYVKKTTKRIDGKVHNVWKGIKLIDNPEAGENYNLNIFSNDAEDNKYDDENIDFLG